MTGEETKKTMPDVPKNPSSTKRVLLSSKGIGWQGLTVETRLHPSGEYQYPAFDHCLISLNLGPSFCLERSVDGGQTTREQMIDGTVIVVPAGLDTLWRHTDRAYFLNIQLSPVLLERMATWLGLGDAAARIRASSASVRDSHVEHLARLLQLEMEAGAPYGTLYAETLADALCVRLLQRGHGQPQLPAHAPPDATQHRVEIRRAVAYMEDNLAADLSLDAIARESGMSTYHFAHLFAQVMGVPPHQYVIRTRIERAKVLISRDRIRLGEVALRVGFSDQSHFTRHFKRLVGVTPRVFAQDANRKNIL